MEISKVNQNGMEIAVVESDTVLISDVQSALDLIATVQYQTGTNNVILNKSAVSEDFFDLSTRVAGEILQKFVQYNMRLAIVGDFSVYTSKSLQSFIYESNRGRSICFATDEGMALQWFSR
ncbi:MAG: DUF4180 domain-containing protein [Firmicutes bacterium]|nr:DUF4180 domain-containing protein [Bacillota bacterium]